MKQMTKRVLAFLLVFGLVVTGPMAPLQTDAYAAPEQESAILSDTAVNLDKVYMNAASGADDNDGTSAATAVASWEQAYALLGDDGGTLVLTGVNALTANLSLPEHTGLVTITAVDGDGTSYKTTISTSGGNTRETTSNIGLGAKYLYLNGPTKFENLSMGNTGTVARIYANGNDLTIGEGLTMSWNNGIAIVGGNDSAEFSGNPNVVVQSGTWSHFYAATYSGTMVSGNARLTVEGGKVWNIYTTNAGTLGENATSEILITGGTLQRIISPGASSSGAKIAGKVTMTLDAASAGDIEWTARTGDYANQQFYAATYAGTMSGTATVNIKGATTLNNKPIYVTNNGSVTGAVTVNVSESAVLDANVSLSSRHSSGTLDSDAQIALNLNGGTVNSAVSAVQSATVNADVASGSTLVLNSALAADTVGGNGSVCVNAALTTADFVGGGTLTLGSNGAVTVGSNMSGTTTLVLPENAAERTYITAPAETAQDAIDYSGSENLVFVNDGTLATWAVMPLTVGPAAPDASAASIDYKNETVSFGDEFELNTASDFAAATAVASGAAVTPGSTLYLRLKATETEPASAATVIVVAARPAAPAAPVIASTTETSITLAEVAGVEYKKSNGEWQSFAEFTGLTAGMPYTFYARIAATDTSFCSNTVMATLSIGTVPVVPLSKVYVDGSMSDYTGHDGSTAALALQDLKAAVAALGTEGGTVVISGATGFGSATATENELPAHEGTVVITAKDETADYAAALILDNDIVLGGPTTFENITLSTRGANRGGDMIFISAMGNKLVLGEGITTQMNNSFMLNVAGVARSAAHVGNTDVTIKSGTYSNVYGASYQGNMTGNTSVLMTGGTIRGTITGGSFRSKVTGDTSLTFDAAEKDDITIKGNIYGSTIRGITDGDAYLTLRGNTVVGTVLYGGGRDASYNSVTSETTGTIYIDMSENATVNNRLYGGGEASKVNDVVLTMRGNSKLADSSNVSYLGANNAVTGDLTAIFSENASTATDFFGGSRLNSNKTFTTESTTIILKDNAKIGGHLRGGGNNGTITGETYIGLLGNSKVNKSVYGSNYNSGETKGKITIELDGGTVGNVLSGGTSEGYSGTASGGADLILKSGTVVGEFATNGVPTGMQKVLIDLSGGGTLKLLGGTTIDSVKMTGGSGSLVLSSGTSLNVTEQPVGTVNLTVDGIPANGTYVTAPAGVSADSISYTSSEYGEQMVYESTADASIWKIEDSLNQPIKVFFDAPEAVEIKVYNKIYSQTDADTGAGFHVEEENRLTPNADGSYTLSKVGVYLTIAYGEGYYRVIKPFWLSDEKKVEAHKNNGGVLHVDANPGKMTVDEDGSIHNQPNYPMDGGTSGASPLQYTRDASVVMLNDELREAGFSLDGLKSFPEGGYKTPAFTKAAEKGKHEYSSPEDMAEFIEELDAADTKDIMRHYIAGYSDQYKFPIHLVTFSETVEIPENATIEETAELFKADVEANGKPIVMLSGQLHGNETSGGEGTMAYMTQLFTDYGDEVLDHVNIIVFPRLNPDGAYMVHRRSTMYNVDMARENIFMQVGENALTAKVYQMFEAHLTIDLHENQANYLSATGMNGTDIWTGGTTPIVTDSISDWVREFDLKNIAEIEEEGLGSRLYSPQMAHPLVRMNYYSLTGSVPVLFEVRGNGIGKDYYDRRVHAHVTGVKAAIPNTAEEAAELLELVNNWREERVKQGGIYDDADPIIIEMTQSGTDTMSFVVPTYTYGGEVGSSTKTYSFLDVVSRSRMRPTGYLIDALVAEADGPSTIAHTSILEMLDRNGLEYFEIPAGATVEDLKQTYAKTVSGRKITEAGLRDAADVTFENGAYFIPMDQVSHPIAVHLMEQDMTSNIDATVNGSLYQRGYLTLDSNNNLPIYHYTQNNPRELLKQFAPEETGAAEFGGIEYTTLAEALAAAQAAGGTVKMLKDASEGALTLMTGMTLDLNGKTLTTDGVMCFGGHMVDSSADNSGKIACMQGMLMLDAANPDLAVWNGTDGYFFTEIEQVLTQEDTSVTGKYKLTFLPRFTQIARIAPLLADGNGGKDHGVEIKVKLVWNGGEKVLTYSDDMIKTVYGGNAFTVTLTGYESFLAQNLQLQVVVVGNGVTAASAPIPVK